MSLIQVINVSMEFSSFYVLKNINCTIEHNSKIGLIGANGSGKSTLIRIILGQLTPTEGKITQAKNCQIAYLPQNITLDPNLVMVDYIKSTRPDFQVVSDRISELSNQLSQKPDELTETLLNMEIDRYHSIVAFNFENDMKYVLTSLNFPVDQWNKSISEFSGGEQTRICLAAMLLAPYDLLILDEPTNHLDIAMIRWLENYLQNLDKPFMVVSHDRQFLDNTISTVYRLYDGELKVTKGNYSSFVAAHEIEMKAREKAVAQQEKWIAKTREFIDRNMAGQKTNQAKARLKQLNKIEKLSGPENRQAISIKLSSASRSGNDLFRFHDVSFGINGKLLAERVNLIGHYRDRIAIIGPNGCGKTTLLSLLLGRRKPISGEIYYGASQKIGYYDQHQDSLDDRLSVKDTLWQLVPLEPVGYVLGWLARFGFRGDDVDKKVSVLSGGERSRLFLSVLIHQKPNLLIMDEPTNHLDIEMTDSLLNALVEFDGSIIFVSHDRYFISELATKYWVFKQVVDDGKLITVIDDSNEQLERVLDLSFNPPEIEKTKVDNRVKKKKLNPWHLDQIHKQIEENYRFLSDNELKLGKIHKLLSQSETYNDPSHVVRLKEDLGVAEQAITDIKIKIAELETKYLELSYEE